MYSCISTMIRSIALWIFIVASACVLSDAFAPAAKRAVFKPAQLVKTASCFPRSRILRMSDEKKPAEGEEEETKKTEGASGTFYDDEVRKYDGEIIPVAAFSPMRK